MKTAVHHKEPLTDWPTTVGEDVRARLEDGRDRQEQFIDAVAGDQLAEKLRTAFGKDGPMALSLQCREDLIDGDALAV